MSLNTRPEEMYRALIESTAFGARTIVERLEEYGVEVGDIITCGGLPEKSPLLMQIYADVTGRELKISASRQTCAVGAAIFGAVAAGKESGGFATVEEAQEKICSYRKISYRPDKENKAIYDRLYALYKNLHDSFGTKTYSGNLFHVMKSLLAIKDQSVNRRNE